MSKRWQTTADIAPTLRGSSLAEHQLHNVKTHYVYTAEYFIQWNNLLINSASSTGTKTAAQNNINNHNNATILGCSLMNKRH